MKRNLVATVCVAAVMVASGVLAAYWLGAFAPDQVTIDGGIVLSESNAELTIWSYCPEVRIDLAGFEGTVLIRNCVPGAIVTGVDDFEKIGDTAISFAVNGRDDEVTIAPPPLQGQAKFAVMGDSQGRNYVLSAILSRTRGCEFALICGDVTPSGTAEEYQAFWETVSQSPVPVYCTMGNHDVKNEGVAEYTARFGNAQYSFDYGNLRFAVVDSSALSISEEQVEWVRETLDGAEHKVMVTHAPPFDPFGLNHTLDPSSCERVIALAESEAIDAVFTGHIHAYNHTILAGTDFIISGGAGAAMIEGQHHFVNVTYDGNGAFSYEKCEVIVDDPQAPHITLVGKDESSVNVTYEDLLAMPQQSGYSSFENYYGNIGGQGDYSGVAVADLLARVGGMSEGDLLRVTAGDGYIQEFGYLNIYPDESWLELQGVVIVALSMNSVTIPDWEDGPKLLMLAPDGLYSNSDCEATSYDDQGYSLYPSAGARWVKNVATMQVVPCP